MKLGARLRPYRGNVVQLLLPAAALFVAVTTHDTWARRFYLCAILLYLVFGAGQLIASWVFRAPALVVDDTGVHLPLVRLDVPWDRIIEIRAHDRRDYGIQHPTIELVVTEPEALIRAAHRWERAALRRDLRSRGTPLVLRFAALDRPMEPFLTAVRDRTGLTVTPEPPRVVPPATLPPPPPDA